MKWNDLTQIDQVQQIIKNSYEKPQIIFKHSTSCSISFMAKMRLESKWHDVSKDVDLHYLDLISHRNISNHIAETFSVYHESPQVILVKDGEAEYDASHFDISVEEINESLEYIYE
ncbi:MAG: bacillithiol system redox-active protein YtxJ [Saprospiraceae bacterium]|nr:bacillithiol system redox-active protein YtxJ [Saprospiraceae bacterium]